MIDWFVAFKGGSLWMDWGQKIHESNDFLIRTTMNSIHISRKSHQTLVETFSECLLTCVFVKIKACNTLCQQSVMWICLKES